MIINRKGSTRIVFLIKKHAIKIPNFLDGWTLFLKGLLANIQESNTWEWWRIPNSELFERSELLCPIIWRSWGGWIVVMKRADPITNQDTRPVFLQLEYFIKDHKDDNYGIINGKVVMIDYGSC